MPTIPFLFNGTLYDPADIVRFNGQELHTIAAPGRDHLIVTDDGALINTWMQMTYASNYPHRAKVVTERGSGSGGVSTTDFGSGVGGGTPGGGGFTLPFPGHASAGEGPPRAILYEHINYGGASKDLFQGWGWSDLTGVYHGLFGLGGDWNDYISSIQAIPGAIWVGLWEHVNQGGSSISLEGGSLDLTDVGWNDRASSVYCW